MKLFALSTSSDCVSFAFQNGTAQSQSCWSDISADGAFSKILNELKKASLNLTDFDCFLVDSGPGSFTGLRVGINMVRAFAFAFKKPVASANCFQIMGFNGFSPAIFCINAHQKSFYLCERSAGGKMGPIQIVGEAELESFVTKPLPWIGPGCQSLPLQIQEKIEMQSLERPQALSLIKIYLANQTIQTMDWKSLIPLYIKSSAAEMKREGRAF